MSPLSIPGSTAMVDEELRKSPTRSIPSPSGKSKPASVDTPDLGGNRIEEDAAKENAQPKVPKRKKASDPERDSQGRIKITIVGSAFVPSKQISYRISSMIHKEYAYYEPLVTWNDIPEDWRLLLFGQLKWRFCWDEDIDDRVYSLWEAKASGYLQQALTKARLSGKKPSWISDKNWSILLRMWEEEEESSEITMRNCAPRLGLKRASPIDEELTNKAKSQKKNGECSKKIAPHTTRWIQKLVPVEIINNVALQAVKGSVAQEMKADTASSAIRVHRFPNALPGAEVKNAGKREKSLQEQVNELREGIECQRKKNEETLEMLREFGEDAKRQQDWMRIMFGSMIEVFTKQNHNPDPHFPGLNIDIGKPIDQATVNGSGGGK